MSLAPRSDSLESVNTTQSSNISTLQTTAAALTRGSAVQWATSTAYQVNDVVWTQGYPINGTNTRNGFKFQYVADIEI